MNKKLQHLFFFAFVLPGLAFLCIAAAPAARDYFISTLVVYPAPAENGTNTVRIFVVPSWSTT